MVEQVDTSVLKTDPEKGTGSNPVRGTDIAWAAGLFEGEGSIFLQTIRKPTKTYKYVRLEMRMNDLDVMQKFHEVLGVGNLQFKYRAEKTWNHGYSWTLNNLEDIKMVMSWFWPYLGKRRKDKATELGINP